MTRQVPASSLFSADSSEYAGIPEGRVKLRFITNHDENAKMSPIREFFGEDGAMAAFVATAFIHGGVLIYDCQVVGYPGKIQFFNYAKVDWNSHRELREEYTKLIGIYKSNSCLRSGDLVPYPDDNVLMFERKDKAGVVLVLANLRDSQQYISIPENLRNQEYVNLMTGNRAPLTDSELLLMPFEYLVLKLS